MTHEEICAVDKAYNNLKKCYQSKADELQKLGDFKSEIKAETLFYAIDIIEIHQSLQNLEWEKDVTKQSKEQNK